MLPATCTAGAPSAWTSAEATGKAGWSKLVSIPPSAWQPRQVAVVAGRVVRSTPNAACFVTVESRACEWQAAQLAVAKSSCGYLSLTSLVCAVWHCSQDWKWSPLAMRNPAGCAAVCPCAATCWSAPPAWHKRQLTVAPPGAGPVPLHSGGPLAGSRPTSPECLTLWSAGSWQTVQSTEVDAPVRWQLLHEMVPGKWTAGAPRAWTSPAATGKNTWSKSVAGSPLAWQRRQLAVSAGATLIWSKSWRGAAQSSAPALPPPDAARLEA